MSTPRRRRAHTVKTTLQILGLLIFAVTQRVAATAPDWYVPPTPHGITIESGEAQARKDLAAGLLQLLEAGTRGVGAPNVPDGDPRFAKLPHQKLPCGCTTPDANLWFQYAKGYNAAVVEHLRNRAAR